MPFGVDEAGKGPVLGSMFAAAVWVEDEDLLPDGIADSKRLTPTRRETLAERIRSSERIAVGVAEITPERIDDPHTDMNSLTVEAHAGSIERALSDVADEATTPPMGLCDACDTDADRFARRVAEACDLGIVLDAEHGADEDSRVVGAASVIAKVERDAHVAALSTKYGEIGSGYPSDPTTRTFLEEYVANEAELPPCARTSWSTCADVLETAGQRSLGEF